MQSRGYRRGLRHDLSEFGSQEAGIYEQRDPQAVGHELVRMTARNAFNNAVQAEAAKVVGHSADGIVGWIESQQLRQ